MPRSFLFPALAAILVASCGGPSGLLGVRWGDDTTVVVRKLQIHDCLNWREWEGKRGFQACDDFSHPVQTFGRPGYVRLFRASQGLEGVAVHFEACGSDRPLAVAVRKEFGLDSSDWPLYRTYPDGAAVHFAYTQFKDTCLLTVGGPRFGKAFAAYQLEEGFKSLSAGLRPR